MNKKFWTEFDVKFNQNGLMEQSEFSVNAFLLAASVEEFFSKNKVFKKRIVIDYEGQKVRISAKINKFIVQELRKIIMELKGSKIYINSQYLKMENET